MTVSAAELASIRADLNALMDQSAVIWRGTVTLVHGWQEAGTVNMGTVSCLLAKMRMNRMEDIAAEREAEANYYLLTVPQGTSLQPEDSVVVSGVTYEIRNLWNAHSLQAAERAVVERLD